MADTKTVVEEAYSAFYKRDLLLQRKIVTSERKRASARSLIRDAWAIDEFLRKGLRDTAAELNQPMAE